MDNDNKIKTTRPELSLFLQDGLMPPKSDIFNEYNFEREFEKTGKNKNRAVMLLFAATCAAALGITAGISRYQSKKNTEITVTINAFQDLNLKRLLASFQRVQGDLENAVAEKEGYKKAFRTAMEEAGFTRDSALVVVNSMILAEQERQERVSRVQNEYTQTTKHLTDNYNRQIAAIDLKIAALQEEISALKTPELIQAQAEQSTLDSRQQVFDLEKRQLVASYEQQLEEQNRRFREMQKQSFESQKQAIEAVSGQFQNQISLLDPVISDEKARQLLTALLDKPAANSGLAANARFASVPAQQLLPDEAEKFDVIRNNITSADYLAELLLARLPQKNSVPQYLSALKNAVAETGSSVTGLLETTVKERGERQQELTLLRSSQEKLLGDTKKQLEAAQSQLAAATKNLADQTAKNSDLTARNTELTKTAAASAASVTALTGQNTALTKQLETANAKVTDLNTKLSAAQTQVSDTKKTLGDTQTKLKAAEAEAALKQQMENYLVYLVSKSGDAGFIVDVGDRKSMLIQVHPSQSTRIENRTVYVFSKETAEPVGTVIIRKRGNNLYAYPTTDVTGQKIAVGDRISLTNSLPVNEE